MTQHCLYFLAPINDTIAGQYIAYLVNIKVAGATRLTIAMHSIGGNVAAGVAMYNAMLSMPFEIVTHNISNTDSIANVVFLGGSQRFANPSSTFMFHGVGFDGNPNERLEEHNLSAKLDTIKSENKRIGAIITARSSISHGKAVLLFKRQETHDATWAKANGLIQDIRDFAIPAGADVKHMIA